MNKNQKEKLVAQYCADGIAPKLTDFQKKFFRQKYAKYIMVNRDDNGNHICTCSACGTEFKADGKTKHNSKMVCPECGKELQIIHTWRKKEVETINWVTIPKTIDENTIMFRYILVHFWSFESYGNYRNERFSVTEEARKVICFKKDKTYTYPFELSPHDGNWYYSKRWYFTEYYMYHRVRFFCDNADEYTRTWFRELNKLAMFRYVDAKEFYNFNWHSWFNVTHLHDRMDLYEKLYKIGLSDLAHEDMKLIAESYYYGKGIKYDKTKTSLTGMLGITKGMLNILRQNPTIKNVKTLQMAEDIEPELLELMVKAESDVKDLEDIRKTGVSAKKVLRYIAKQKCVATEWVHYRDMLETLEYDITDKSYLFPRDFRKEDMRLLDEMMKLESNGWSEQSKLMFKIAQGLRENKELMEAFTGCKGLQVYVPESAYDLLRESKLLHNCIGGYIDRYAKGKTLLFFIRRIDEPDKPFVAMEYCHGKVVQCRYDHNKPVEEDSKIINLAERIAETLREQNILAA